MVKNKYFQMRVYYDAVISGIILTDQRDFLQHV